MRAANRAQALASNISAREQRRIGLRLQQLAAIGDLGDTTLHAAYKASLDKALATYFEDVELCQRLSVAGWEIHFAPVATIVHVGGCSTDQRRTATAVERMRAAGRWYRHRYRGARGRPIIALQRAVVATWWVRDRLQRTVARDPTRRRVLDEDLAAWEILIRKGL